MRICSGLEVVGLTTDQQVSSSTLDGCTTLNNQCYQDFHDVSTGDILSEITYTLPQPIGSITLPGGD
jgi:hypothetical protein